MDCTDYHRRSTRAQATDSLVLPNLKNPSRPIKRDFLPAGQADLPGALLLWAMEHGLADDRPLFFSHKGCPRRTTAANQPAAGLEIVRAAEDPDAMLEVRTHARPDTGP